jgi:SAM-dependent methyltransferase
MATRPWRVEFFEAFATELEEKIPPGGRVLELGSGPGFLTEYVIRRLGEISYTLLDFSRAMHELARDRLGDLTARSDFVVRDLRDPAWHEDLGCFDAVITNQAVHELRHKRYAQTLHSQVRSLLPERGLYLVSDHVAGVDGMANTELYMSVEEQESSLLSAGFQDVRQILLKGGMVLHCAAPARRGSASVTCRQGDLVNQPPGHPHDIGNLPRPA